MKTKSDQFQVHVLEGVQQGSRQVLLTAQTQTVGNSFDCDIYLHDDGESTHQVQLLPGKFSISISLIDGDAIIDSQTMVIGQQYKLSPGVPVRLGKSLFVVEALGDMPGLSDVPVTHFDNEASRPDAVAHQVLPFNALAGSAVSNSKLINRLYRPSFLILLIGFGLVGSVFAAWRTGPMQAEAPTEPQLETQAADTQHAEASDATTIENSVIDVFRTYGLNAEASSIRAGVVKVKTPSTDTTKIAAAQASANADVYGLRKLIVDHDRPPVEKSEMPKRVVSKPAGQEIRMIVIGNPTYVVDENQSRYFKGSKLPTGHRVADIRKGLVVVEKNGVTTELKL